MYKGEAPDGLAVAVKVMALSSETAEEARGMHVCIRCMHLHMVCHLLLSLRRNVTNVM